MHKISQQKIESDALSSYWMQNFGPEDNLKKAILASYQTGDQFNSDARLIFINKQVEKILDFGCGIGRNITLLKQYAKQVDGFDFHTMVNRMHPKTMSDYHRVYTNWQETEDKYDIVFCSIVLHHFSENLLVSILQDFKKMTKCLYVLSRWYLDDSRKILVPIIEKYFRMEEWHIYPDANMLRGISNPNESHFEAKFAG